MSVEPFADDVVTDEHKARVIAQRLLLNPDISYWNELTPELRKLVETNPQNTDLLLPIAALVRKCPQVASFQDSFLTAIKPYDWNAVRSLYPKNNQNSVEYIFSMLITITKDDREQVIETVELLNHSMPELIEANPEKWAEAETDAERRRERAKENSVDS